MDRCIRKLNSAAGQALRFALCAALFAVLAPAQTFEINQPLQPSPAAPKSAKKTSKSSQKKGESSSSIQISGTNGIGWGSSIEVGRMARAAQQALAHNNVSAAENYAQRAVRAAPGDPRLWFLLGYTSRLAGNYKISLDAYQHGLRSAPGNPDGLSGMAQTYAKMGNSAQALSILNSLIREHPDRVDDMLVAGELYIQNNDLQQGLGLLQRAEARKPSAHSELLMAIAYMRLKQPARAKQLLDQAKRRDPRNVEIFRAVANYYREERDYQAAITTLKSAPRQTPEVLGDLAYSYELSGDMKNAAANYVRAANEDPKNIGMQLSAAQSEAELNDLPAANSFLERAQKIDPNHYRLHAIRASIARSQNRDQDAVQEYQTALANLPQGAPPEGELYPVLLRLNLAELYRDMGQQAQAEQQLALAQQQIAGIHVEGPQKAEFLRVRASIEEGANNFAAAENDLKQAMTIDPGNTNVNLQYASLLWKTDRKPQARAMYQAVLAKDPKNRFAIESLGYLARDMGDPALAEKYFNRLAADYPHDYVAYLALGDLFTSERDFSRADLNYQRAYQRENHNAIIIANGANAAIESGRYSLAKVWVDRATGALGQDPRVMVQKERYLFHKGDYLASARLGYQVLKQQPVSRDGSVYLGYDLYNLGRYTDLLALTSRYENILPKEPNFPLLSGHVHRQSGLLDEAAADYSRAIARDPKIVDAYVNRGYVENDLQQASQAEADFETALRLNPQNGIAHLGLAFSDLQLRHGRKSLQEADQAQKLMGDGGAIHLAKATAYRQMRSLSKAETEYRAALHYAPDDEKLHSALADDLYYMRRYSQSLAELKDALRLAPEDSAQIYAQMAHNTAHLHERAQTMDYVKAAEQEDNNSSAILLDTGDALLTLGDRDAAMQRFERALEAPDADRVEARLSIARLFVREGKWDDAQQQVALAFAEARVGEAAPVTTDEIVEAANIFLDTQNFDLARRYYLLAQKAGGGDEATAVGLANTYLVQGDDRDAQKVLAQLGNPADYQDDYDYNMALGNVYRHHQDDYHALTAFARANELAGDSGDEQAERDLMDTAGNEGIQITQHLSTFSDLDLHGLYDDPTVYQIDAKILDPKGVAALQPLPRASTEILTTQMFKYNQPGLPPIHGFFQLRNASGTVSLPSDALILKRNTHDFNFNAGMAPSLHLGTASINFDFGTQFTVRRDSYNSESAMDMDQNLFRQYLYISTSALGNWLTFRGNGYHEAGPFTLRSLTSRDLGGKLEFQVGRPWGKTSLLTGYSVRDLQFHPFVREFFATSTYAGLERKFGTKVDVKALGEYIRSWRVQDFSFAIGQAIRPAGEIQIQPNDRWLLDGKFAYGRGEGFHLYDNTLSSFFISYSQPLHRAVSDGSESVPAEYPLRFALGFEQERFMNFAGRGQTFLRPVVRLTLF